MNIFYIHTKLKHYLFSSADEPLLDSTHRPMGFLGEVPSPTGSPPSAFTASNYTAFESPDSPGALPSISKLTNDVRTAAITHFHWGHVASENPKSYSASGLLAEDARPLSIPLLSPSKSVLESSPQFETTAKLSSNWKSHSNIYIESSRPPVFARSTTAQVGLNSEHKSTFNKEQDGASEQTLAIMTTLPGLPLEPPDLAFADSPADQSYSNILHINQLSPSSAPLEENKPAHDINMLPHADEIPAPGYNVPFIAPHPTSTSSEPTEVFQEDFYPTNTMELDWGSGDYLETMSFLNSDGEDYSPVTKLPSESYDLEDYTENYDTSFPSRVGIFPSSLHFLHVSPTPSLMTAYSNTAPQKSIYASSFSTAITLKPTPTSNSDIPNASDIDWVDTFTIQPTDVLLPDMNSLEYYTTQLTKENNSLDTGAEHRGNVSVVSISATDITPTSNFTNDTKLTEDEPSSDLSGSEPHDESRTVVTTEESPQLVNTSEPFLDPSIVPTHFFDQSSSTWGNQASTTDWTTPTLTISMDNTVLTEPMLPSATPLLPDDVIPYSSLTDVHWFVTESFPQSTIHTTPVLTAATAFFPVPTIPAANASAGTTELTSQESTFTTQQTLNSSLVSNEPTSNVSLVPPAVLGDQGVTEDWVDIPATVTLIPTNSDANTVFAVPTTTTATTTSHQATTRTTTTTEAATNVNIILTTSGKITTTASASRQFLCNLDRPVYLVKIGKNHIYLCFVLHDNTFFYVIYMNDVLLYVKWNFHLN